MKRRNLQNLSIPEETNLVKNRPLPHLGFGAGFPPYVRGNHTFISQKSTKNILKDFNSLDFIEISSSSLLNAEATPAQEIAMTLASGLAYLETGKKQGLPIDNLAPRLCFIFSSEKSHFVEVAKLRAARMLWAKQLIAFQPKNEKSLRLRIHSQINTKINPENHIEKLTQITLNSLSAILAGSESIQPEKNVQESADTKDLKSIPNITELLLDELHITHTVDPWAGNQLIEELTYDLFTEADRLINEIRELNPKS